MPPPPLSKREFLEQIEKATRLCLLGPLFKGRYEAKYPTIYVDGGADFALGLAPSLHIGDGDSARSAAMDIQLPSAKDRSDLAYALALIPVHIVSIELFGFLGGRRDHELIGLGEVAHFLRSRTGTRTDFDNSITGLSSGTWDLDLHGVFSLISFEQNSVSLAGACLYPLAVGSKLEPVSSLGLSNEGLGTVTLTCSKPLFIFFED